MGRRVLRAAAAATAHDGRDPAFEGEGGSKQKLSDCLADLAAMGVDTEELLRSIDAVIVRTLMCVKNKIGPQPNCFEVFGFDVMLDSKLKPWVIEANASPSMNLNHAVDREVKPQMLADTLMLVDPLPFDRSYLAYMLAARAKTGAWPLPPGAAPDAAHEERLNAHLHRLLRGRVPRLFGQLPARMGGYRRLAPGGPGTVYGDLAKFRNLVNRVRFNAPGAKTTPAPPTALVPVVQPGGGVAYVRKVAKKTEYGTGNIHRDALPGIV